MNCSELFEYLEGLRRDAYVRAVIRASESDDVTGYIGSHVPVEILESFGLMAIPVHGIDGDILSYSCEKNLCPLIDATITYAKIDKCPLIHSAKMIIVDDFCPLMTREMLKLNKNVFIYDGDNETLIHELEDTYHRCMCEVKDETEEFIQRLKSHSDTGDLEIKTDDLIQELKNHSEIYGLRIEADELIHKLKNYSDIDGLRMYIAEYYTKFLPVDERVNLLREVSNHFCFYNSPVEFTRVKVQSASGIYRQIDSLYGNTNYRIIEDFCDIRGNYDYVYESCPYCEGERINYTRG